MSDSEIIITIISRKIDTLLRRIKKSINIQQTAEYLKFALIAVYTFIFCTFVVIIDFIVHKVYYIVAVIICVVFRHKMFENIIF